MYIFAFDDVVWRIKFIFTQYIIDFCFACTMHARNYGPEIKNFSKNYLIGLYFSPVSAIYKFGFRTV